MKKGKKPQNTSNKPPTKPNSELKLVLMIIATALIGYGLSVLNNFCLDDFIVIGKNKFTQQGLAGIKDILANDTFAGMTEGNIMVLAGGRYRPLSLVTFAIEHQFYGDNAFMMHLINVLLYAGIGILLFRLLVHVQMSNKIAAIISILFMALPAHSEPVINVKGRDDLLCFFFFLMAALQLFRYVKSQKQSHLIYSVLFYFLSLMSKESAVTFVAVFPLMLFCFSKSGIKKIISTTAVYVAPALLFLLFRYLATAGNNPTVSNDVLNQPFVNADTAGRYATVFYTWLLYFKILIYPVHLSYDYNFNQIAITGFSNVLVWISIFIHINILISGIYFIRRKPFIAFGLLFYLITFSVYSNLFFDIGAPFADRFILIPSAGLCIALVVAIADVINSITDENQKRIYNNIAIGSLVIVVAVFSARNISRCTDWKDNNTLFLADVDDAPNSAKVQLNAGLACLNKVESAQEAEKEQLYSSAKKYFENGIKIYPDFPDGYLNIGVIYNWKGDYENAELWWKKAYKLKPDNSSVHQYFKVLATYYYQQGMQSGAQQNFRQSISQFQHALQYDSLNADILYNTGGAYFSINQTDSAAYYFGKTLKVNPAYQQAQQGLAALQARR